MPVNTLLVDAANPARIFAGTDNGVFVLGADGAWSAFSDGLPNAFVVALAQNPATGTLIAATHGRGVFALDLGSASPRLSSFMNSVTQAQGPASPGMLATLTGVNVASGPEVHLTASLPDSLGGTTVLVNGEVAPLISVSETEINFVMPYALKGAQADINVITANGRAAVRVPMAAANPAIFRTDEASVYHGDGTPVSDAAPALVGEEVVLYAAGLGAVDQPVIPSGASPSDPLAQTLLLPVVRVGGAAANVSFSGLTPGLIATYQVNFVVPCPSGQSSAGNRDVRRGEQHRNNEHCTVARPLTDPR